MKSTMISKWKQNRKVNEMENEIDNATDNEFGTEVKQKNLK